MIRHPLRGTYSVPPLDWRSAASVEDAGRLDLSSARPHAPTAVNGETYTYLATGNLSSGIGRTYSWDGENRLTNVTVAATGSSVSYIYGPDGARQRKTANSGTGGASQTTLYLGADMELDPAGTWTLYPHPSLRITKKPAAADTLAYLHKDHLGSVRAITGAAGIRDSRGHSSSGAAEGAPRPATQAARAVQITRRAVRVLMAWRML